MIGVAVMDVDDVMAVRRVLLSESSLSLLSWRRRPLLISGRRSSIAALLLLLLPCPESFRLNRRV